MRRCGSVSIVMIILIIAFGCADNGAGPTIVKEPDWEQIDLPADTAPVQLTTDGYNVAVGGRKESGPWIGVVDQDQLHPVQLNPRSPYGKTAEIVSLDRYSDQLVALGNVHGGAHGNSRWTVWRGNTETMIEHPQSLGTFGGTDGGDLAEIMINAKGPLIVGSRRFDNEGLDPAVWLPNGDRWRLKPSDGTDLEGSATEQKSVRTGIARTDRMILVGSVLDLDNGVRQHAVGWLQTGDWQQFELPGRADRSEATAIACAAPGPREPQCMITGSADGRLAGWWLTDDVAETITGLPEVTAASTGPPARPMITADLTAIAYDTEQGCALSVDTGAGWQAVSTPAGQLLDAVAVGPTAYLLLEDGGQRQLWRAPLT